MNGNRSFAIAFAAGLAAIAWIAWGFVASGNWLALGMTVVITAAYLLGVQELRQFRADTHALAQALDAGAPESLPSWLARVPPSLRDTARLRVEGERAPLPGPTLTPYLVGLLVMLGMLGTFLGMVVTFKGAVFALQGSTDLQAIRAALAEPIRGLGLSFGTSIAGVTASALLGLLSALARRERLDASRALDERIASVLRPFSFAHRRDETFRALQGQAAVLPEVVEKLQALMDGIEQRSRALDDQLQAGQARFHAQATQSYEQLARAVGASLQDSLVAAATAAGDSIRPAVASAMDRIAAESQRQDARVADSARAQVDALSASFRESTMALVAAVGDTLARSQQEHAARESDRLQAWSQSLEGLASRLEAQWQHLAGETVQQMAALGGAMEAPVQRLLQTASDVPAAAAGVLAKLREEVGRAAERDNLALQERTVLLEKLGTVLQEVQQAAGAQRDAIASLVQSTTGVLHASSRQFAELVDANVDRSAKAADQLATSSTDMAGLAHSFQQGVQHFEASNGKVLATLEQVQSTMQRSIERSDEQLAYYVAQAREVIDLSISSQADIVAAWRQLQGKKPAVAQEAAG